MLPDHVTAAGSYSLDLGDRGAELSHDDRYRYRLWRTWGEGPVALFVMLNPSTADASRDDPTLRRCIRFAQREDCGGLQVVNLYGYRTPSPAALRAARALGQDVIGPGNFTAIATAFQATTGPAIAAWGSGYPKDGTARLNAVAAATAADRPLWCLGRTKDGNPCHPLYLRSDAPLERWP